MQCRLASIVPIPLLHVRRPHPFVVRTGSCSRLVAAMVTGAQLMDVGLHVTGMLGSQASEIVWITEVGSDTAVA